MASIIMILTAFVCACMAETSTASGSEIGYAMESFAGSSYPELVQSIAGCAADDDCHLVETALAAYPIPDAEYVESLFPAIDEEGEVPAVEEAVMSAEDNADGRRQLAAIGGTYSHWCANEGGWCPCWGHVAYTKKCAGFFSCNQASWERVVSERWIYRADVVRGAIRCNNALFGGDPWPGHEKQCFCHPSWGRRQLAIDEEAEVPAVEEAVMSAEDNADDRRQLAGLPDRYGWARQEQPTQYDYVQKWTEPRCNQQCGSPGAGWFSSDWWKGVWCGFSCTGACPARAAAFAAGREHTFPIGQCAEHCYCVFKGWTG